MFTYRSTISATSLLLFRQVDVHLQIQVSKGYPQPAPSLPYDVPLHIRGAFDNHFIQCSSNLDDVCQNHHVTNYFSRANIVIYMSLSYTSSLRPSGKIVTWHVSAYRFTIYLMSRDIVRFRYTWFSFFRSKRSSRSKLGSCNASTIAFDRPRFSWYKT